MKTILKHGLVLLVIITVYSCNQHPKDKAEKKPNAVIYRGLYSFGPEVKSFKDCGNGQEYWAADSSAKLELSYTQLHFEKPYEPVYVEVEGRKVKSGKDALGSEFDSTLVVTKMIKITKDIPQDRCK